MKKLSGRFGACAYTANPDTNSTFGMTVSPVSGSNGGKMSYFANTLAMTSQIVEWAKWTPGHILQCIVFEIWIKLSSQLRAHGPSSKTEYDWFRITFTSSCFRVVASILFLYKKEETIRVERLWVRVDLLVVQHVPKWTEVCVNVIFDSYNMETHHKFGIIIDFAGIATPLIVSFSLEACANP